MSDILVIGTATTYLTINNAGGQPVLRVIDGPGWSWDIAGRGIRIDTSGSRRLSLQASDASTIRYDGQQIEVVFGDGSANFALVPRHQGLYAPSFEVRNTYDTDGIWMQYGLNNEPTIQIVGSSPAARSLYIKRKNADSIALTVDGGIRLRDTGTRPTATAGLRGVLWATYADSGQPDTLAVCLKAADESYSWITVVSG